MRTTIWIGTITFMKYSLVEISIILIFLTSLAFILCILQDFKEIK